MSQHAAPTSARAANALISLHVSRAHRAALGTLLATPTADRLSTLRDIAAAMGTPAGSLLPSIVRYATPSQRADLARTLPL